jgi:hypothetical protein
MRNKEELIQMVRNRAADRGFKVTMPYGFKNATIYFSCANYRAPGPKGQSLSQENSQEDKM